MSGWDVIVVGLGSAGAPLAARLSEDSTCRVLAIEAGPSFRGDEAPAAMHAADAYAILDPLAYPSYQWLGASARLTADQSPTPYVRGRGTGGTSSINWRIALRAPADSFDGWPAGWSWADVLPHYCHLEDDLDFAASDHHGSRGPIPISRLLEPVSWSSVEEAILEAATDAGLAFVSDANAPDATGVSPLPFNGTAQARVSTNDGYLDPARSRANLEIRGDVLVDRVVLDGRRRAVGVEVIDGSGRQVLEADEIVLCAGALASPAILQRSGIGLPGALEPLSIPVVADLPVGRHAQDHPAVVIGAPISSRYRPAANRRAASMCIRTASPGGALNELKLTPLVPGSPDAPFPYALLTACLDEVTSEGSVTITNADPTIYPAVELRLLDPGPDRARLREATRLAIELFSAKAVRSSLAGGAVSYELADSLPSLGRFDLADAGDDTALDRWMRSAAITFSHLSSTCRMGNDPATSVVDGACRVHGVEGLRVADISVTPRCPRANPNLTAIMIGERVASTLRLGR